MTDEDKYKPPKPELGDLVHRIVRSAIEAVPTIGSSAVEYFAELVQVPLETRKKEWMEQEGQGLRKLEEASRARAQDLREDPEWKSRIPARRQAFSKDVRTS